jgi:hypothetical protein
MSQGAAKTEEVVIKISLDQDQEFLRPFLCERISWLMIGMFLMGESGDIPRA